MYPVTLCGLRLRSTVRQLRTTSPLKNIIKLSNEKFLIMFIKHFCEVYKLNYHEQILYVTAYT